MRKRPLAGFNYALGVDVLKTRREWLELISAAHGTLHVATGDLLLKDSSGKIAWEIYGWSRQRKVRVSIAQ